MHRPSRDKHSSNRRDKPVHHYASGRKHHRGAFQQRPARVPTFREAKPAPLGNRCNPACPLFRCLKNALMIKLEDGKPKPYCTWAGDICIGHTCQYASCSARYLLPDGRCLAAIRSRERKSDSFEEEIEKEVKSTKFKSLLSRRGLNKDLESELF